MRRLFSGPGSLDSIAHEKDILCPEETETISPSVFLPGQLERVVPFRNDPWFRTSSSEQIAEATSNTTTHPPTIAYHVKNSVLFDGSIYVGRYRYPLYLKGEKSIFTSTRKGAQHINDGALASTYLGTRFFGHWLSDDCTQYMLAEHVARVICVSRTSYRDVQEYQACFGQDWTPTDRAYIDRLTIYQDSGQNSHKRKRYEALRWKIRSQYQPLTYGSGVYLRRGNSGKNRSILNEDEIVNKLVNQGFTVIDVESDTLSHIVGYLLGAKIVISMEGSQIAHCIYSLPDNSAILALEPPDRFTVIHRNWSSSLGIKFGFVVGSGSEAGYHFSVAEILKTVDLLLNRVEVSTKSI